MGSSAEWWPRRGEIYWIDWSPSRGSEQAGRRPGLVISSDSVNRSLPVCTVAALTTQLRPNSRLQVTLPAQVTGKEAQVLPFQVMTVARERLDDFIAEIPPAQLAEVEAVLRLVWSL